MKNEKSILIVLGMHRSGTSVATRMLSLLGANPGGNLMLPAEDNPTGFWEPVEIVKVHEELLDYLGYSWNDPRPLPYKWWERPDLSEFGTRLCQLAREQYSDIEQPIIKDPRFCRLLPFWQNIFKQLGWKQNYLLIGRTPLDVASSLAQRDGFASNRVYLLWLRYIIESEKWSRGGHRTFLLYDQLLDDWEKEIRRCHYELHKNKLSLSASQKIEINALIDKTLRHSHVTEEAVDASPELSLFISDAFRAFQQAAAGTLAGAELEAKFDTISQGLSTADNLYSSIWSPYLKAFDSNNARVMELNKQVQDMNVDLGRSRGEASALREYNDELMDKMLSLSEEAGQSEALENELKRIREEYIANRAELERRIDRLVNENQEIVVQLARKDAELLASTDDPVKYQYEVQNKELLDVIETIKKDKVNLANSLDDAERSQYVWQQICSIVNSQLKALQEESCIQAKELSQYKGWMQEINRDIKALFLSNRWRFGEQVGKLACLIKMQRDPKTAKEQLFEILGEYERNLQIEERSYDYVHTRKSEDAVPGQWATLYSLTIAALKNPSQTARLLTGRRVINLFHTIFRRDPYLRESIYDQYLKLYQDKGAKATKAFSDAEFYDNIDVVHQVLLAENPKVSIIIPAYNQWDYTQRCIKSIIHHNKNYGEYEIILADDHSSDETIYAENIFPFLVKSKPLENIGFLRNCNLAANKARGEYLVFLNNDTVVHENWLQALVDIIDNDSSVGLVGSKLVYPDGKLQEAGGIIWRDGSGWNYGRMDDPDKPEYNYVREVDYISGASIMVRASLWNELGGFDERYVPAYYEDTDLAFAVREAGLKVVYTPFSVVTHFEGQSHGTDESAGIKKCQFLNNQKFLEKWNAILAEKHFPNAENLYRAKDRGTSGKTILVIDHYVPRYDKDAGSRSTFQYLKWFVEKGLTVKFIGDNFYNEEPYTSELQKIGIEVLYGVWYAENWREWLKINGNYIDYAYLHRPHIAPNYIDSIRKYSKAKIIYFGHDLHYLRIQRQYEVEQDKNLIKDAKEWKEKENAIFDKVDVTYYPSFVEVNEISKGKPPCQVRAIPLNIIKAIEESHNFPTNRCDLLFVGGFNHKPNVDAVTWFVEDIFPFVIKNNKNIKLNIVGSNMPKQIRKLCSPSIIIHGEVSDDELEALYNDVRIVIVPLRYGAGIKGKVLEALRLQVPVVTTSIGSEGLEDAERYLRIEDKPESFAEEIINLYNDDVAWSKQVENGVKAINRYFSSDRVSEILGNDIDF